MNRLQRTAAVNVTSPPAVEKEGRREGGGKKQPLRQYLKNHWLLYVMLVPTVVYLLIFSYYPMLGLQIAFKDWKLNGGIWGSPWCTTESGALDLFKHFRELIDDRIFFEKFGNTLRISCLRLLCGFPVPILIALFLNEMTSTKFKKVVQTVSYLPYFISWIIISGMLISMTESGSSFQNFLSKLFGKELYFFTDSNLFITLLIVSDIWKNAGWGTIIYFAAITNIDPNLYEAAMIDGAGRAQRMTYITLPGIVPALSINLIFSLSGIVYGGFDQIFNMYNTTVHDKADILETYLFRVGVSGGNYDVATALGLFNSVIAFAMTLAANFTVKLLGGEGIW